MSLARVFTSLLSIFTFTVVGGYIVAQVWIMLSDLDAFPDGGKEVASVLQSIIGMMPSEPLTIALLLVLLPSVLGTILVALAR